MLIDRLIRRILELKSPIVVGLDPRLEQIPTHFKEPFYQAHGRTPAAAAELFLAWGKEIIDQVCDLVPALKPQIAMYEQLGAPGIDSYIQTVAYAKSKGMIVVGDIKRGDIASTAAAYADGHLGRVEIDGSSHQIFDEDFITVNPYLGFDSVEPYIESCKRYERGVFALVKTSNPHSFQIQDIPASDGRPVYAHVGKLVSGWGEALIGSSGFSEIGAVVGATHPDEGKLLRTQMPHTFFLVPGYGAQGASAKDLRGVFNKDGVGALVNSSRGITGAYALEKYRKNYSEKDFAQAARAAVTDMRSDLNQLGG